MKAWAAAAFHAMDRLPMTIATMDAASLSLRRSLGGGANHIIEHTAKIFQSCRRNDDRIAPAVNVLGNPQKSAAGIFLEREDESFSLDLDFIAVKCVLDHRRLMARVPRMTPLTLTLPLSVRPVAVRRWTFVRYHTTLNSTGACCSRLPLRTLTERGLSTLPPRLPAGQPGNRSPVKF